MSSLNQKMIDLATAIRTKRGLASTELLSLDEMIEQIYLLEHDFYKQTATGTTSYSTFSSDLNKVAPYAFYGLQGINTMTFTNSELTSIEDHAFQNSSIAKVVLPTSVKTLGASAFEGSSLSNINASNVTSVGKACFKNTKFTTSPTLSSSTTILPEEFCSHTTSNIGPLTKISIPYSCIRIEPAAFDNLLAMNSGNPKDNTKFQDFSGPNVEHIGTDNFSINGFRVSSSNNQYLVPTVFNFPKLKTLKHGCFYMYGQDGTAYWNYYGQGYYKFNFSSLETMGHTNFWHVPFKQITSTEFPALKSIGQRCFCMNDYLTKVNLPLLENIKSASTESSEGLWADDYKVAIVSNGSPWADCPNLTSVTLPALKELDIDFEGCTSLTTIDLTAIKTIFTFESTSLTHLIIRNETPPTLYTSWSGGQPVDFSTALNIYVPNPELYAELDNWQYYYQLGRIKPLSEYEG